MNKVKNIGLSFNEENAKVVTFTISEAVAEDASLVGGGSDSEEQHQIKVEDLSNVLAFVEYVAQNGSTILPKDLVERIQKLGGTKVDNKAATKEIIDSKNRHYQELSSKLELIKDQVGLLISEVEAHQS